MDEHSLRKQYIMGLLNNIIAEAERTQELEFPYKAPRNAAVKIRGVGSYLRDTIERDYDKLDDDRKQVKLGKAFEFLKEALFFLGLIGRSNSSRIAFESYWPLERLASSILSKKELILSSEWELSPFIVQPQRYLNNVLFIGLPASESSFPLLLPLAGHELGHAVWNDKIPKYFIDKIDAEVERAYKEAHPSNDSVEQTTLLFAVPEWDEAKRYCQKQLNELFCDIIGLIIFRESFMHAFAYLLASIGDRTRNPYYPDLRERAIYLTKACEKLDIKFPSYYAKLFTGKSEIDLYSERKRIMLKIADERAKALFDDAVDEAQKILGSKFVPKKSREEHVNNSLDYMKLGIPPEKCESLAELIGLGWRAYNDPSFWDEFKANLRCDHQTKEKIVSELINKGLEIFEVEQRTETAYDTKS